MSGIPNKWEVPSFDELTINFDGHRVPVKASDRALRRGKYPYYGASGIIDQIDDYLYECGIVHAYEREVKNINEKVLCDFFIPARNEGKSVYLEYWGKEDEKYDLRRAEKKEIYVRNNLPLIELENDHIFSLDDHLPRMLLKYKIRID